MYWRAANAHDVVGFLAQPGLNVAPDHIDIFRFHFSEDEPTVERSRYTTKSSRPCEGVEYDITLEGVIPNHPFYKLWREYSRMILSVCGSYAPDICLLIAIFNL